MSSIEDFTPEVLEKIFTHLPILHVLQEVMLVSGKFHDVIVNSTALMKQVVLIWTDLNFNEKSLINSPRKYSNVHLTSCSEVTANLSKFISYQSSTITSLHFHDCSFSYDELCELLKTVAGSLEDLLYIETVIQGGQCIGKVELPKLKSLQVSRADEDQTAALSAMSMIVTQSLRRFIYHGVGMIAHDQKEIDVLDELLRCQTNLTELELPPLHSKPFIKRFLEIPFTLSLKKLTLELYNPAIITNDKRFFHDTSLAKFFATRKSTLKDLTLGNCVLDSKDLKLILSLKLHKVEFECCKFILDGRLDVSNQSIKSFSFLQHGRRDAEDEIVVASFLKSCKNLETATFVYGTVTMPMSLILSEELAHLKILHLRNCSIVAMPYPGVKEVAVYRCSRDEIVQLVVMNPQLKILRVQQELREDETFTRILQRFPRIEVIAQSWQM